MTFLEQLTDSIGIVLNSIEATMQTEGLLKQSQQLAGELQTQQKELQQTNEQLEQKAQQLAERNVEVERKNQEIEQARRALEEKATELSLTSKYKSEFLANMSHELRTPLNSILILGQQLTENPDGNLSAKQVEFARTIHGAGTDLLNLISDILDLSKIESGTVTVDAEEILTSSLLETVGRPFRHEAENRQLSFSVEVDENLARSMVTDSKRLQQVLKNLLSNAFKFTAEGGVRLTVSAAVGGWSAEHPILNHAPAVVAFEVTDTGIGIPLEKQKLIFEAFQQADAGTSRKYGGTGLGLAISRELASLLGGEIHLRSAPGKGSTFVLYLPLKYSGPTVAPRIPAPSPFASAPALQAAATQERVIEQLPDDRLNLEPGDTILLIVEDDPHYARVLIDLARDNIADVATAIAGGDLSKKITVNVSGEILQLKETLNTMVDQLNAFAGEVTRVAREVGTEGRLGGQANVLGVAGTWKDLTESVNSMASNLTAQVRNIAEVTTAVANGDLSKKITVDVRGEILELKDTINTMVDQLNAFAGEVTRVAREVGTEGKLGGQALVRGVAGTWKDLTDSVNSMAGNLTGQVRNIAEVATAVAKGDLSKKITVNVSGEILQLKETLNTMVDQLNAFAGEVTRVAREVGTDGKLGGQAEVPGVAGTWKDLTDSVNSMAGNLTAQVRNIAEVATAIAGGDLSRKITVDVRGEILQLKETLNTMVDQLNRFAGEVTRVAREVGTEGRLGGQANVPGVAGTWKDLTDSVNSMAGNLTAQVRNIAEVTTAVAQAATCRARSPST